MHATRFTCLMRFTEQKIHFDYFFFEGVGTHKLVKKKKKASTKKKAQPNTQYTCYTCGRKGHKSTECYATTTIDGDYIESDDY